MFHRDFRFKRMTALAAVATMLAFSAPAVAGLSEEDVPSTSVVPAEGPGPSSAAPAPAGSSATTPQPAPSESGVMSAPAPKAKPHTHHAAAASARAPEIEPAQAKLKVLQDAPVYSAPAKTSKRIEQLTRGKFVVVTGATHYYLQVQLKSGQTGYVDPSAVELVKPTDKVFTLTHNAGVLEKPNRWAKQVAEVHQGHNVHVIGIALNYTQIRMKNGLEGFIPLTALE